jgi:hypothetical protein
LAAAGDEDDQEGKSYGTRSEHLDHRPCPFPGTLHLPPWLDRPLPHTMDYSTPLI